MKRSFFFPLSALGAALMLAGCLPVFARAQNAPRPPSVPLVAHNPYFSIWSDADTLNGDDTRHWTGTPQPMHSLVRVDGVCYRLMGRAEKGTSALLQTGLSLTPTRTSYTFRGAGVQVVLSFLSPLLPADLDVLSRPVTYVAWNVSATDGKKHAASVYFDAAALLAVNKPEQPVTWQREAVRNLTTLSVGTAEQPVLAKRGDDLRIDWGHLYVAAPGRRANALIASHTVCAAAFAANGSLPAQDDARKPRPAADEAPVLAFAFPLGDVSAEPISRHLLLAYDDEYGILFFGHKLRPYWRRNGRNAAQLLSVAERDYPALQARCQAFDTELMADLTRAGGDQYAYIAALAFRQSLAAQTLVADAHGQPLSFSKENFSNGCISTVDVIYPASPELLLFSPTLVKASLTPVLEYAASPRWKWPFAPHDLGTYPVAGGQVYGGGERTINDQMPVEESGNMLLMLAALAKSEGNAPYVAPYWVKITQWADYLVEKGFDPENQLSTDDFSGHLAHNVNLSAKAIEALGAYAYLCHLRGDETAAAKYRKTAGSFAARWVTEAASGDHYRLTFDKPDSWSQKYNLAWDQILGLNLFPASVARAETDYYRTKMNRYGLPLDSRDTCTKLDWTVWAATLSNNRADFVSLVAPIYDFLNTTPDRVPMTDFYQTKEPRQSAFQARSVVGGVFIRLLDDPATWNKWVHRDPDTAHGWATLPAPPVVTVVVPTSQAAGIPWHYTTTKPAPGWFSRAFDDSTWKTGLGGFGTPGTPGATIGTRWDTGDIWIRRTFTMPAGDYPSLQLLLHHDEDAEVYINGILAASAGGFTAEYDTAPLSAAGRAAIKPGLNTFAIHCHQTVGGQYIDAGLVTVVEAK